MYDGIVGLELKDEERRNSVHGVSVRFSLSSALTACNAYRSHIATTWHSSSTWHARSFVTAILVASGRTSRTWDSRSTVPSSVPASQSHTKSSLSPPPDTKMSDRERGLQSAATKDPWPRQYASITCDLRDAARNADMLVSVGRDDVRSVLGVLGSQDARQHRYMAEEAPRAQIWVLPLARPASRWHPADGFWSSSARRLRWRMDGEDVGPAQCLGGYRCGR